MDLHHEINELGAISLCFLLNAQLGPEVAEAQTVTTQQYVGKNQSKLCNGTNSLKGG